MSPASFDPLAFKQTTREQWDDAAEAWNRWGPVLEDWLGAATVQMLDLARVDGARVLDIAAGTGGQTFAAASRAASVLATDLSPAILEFIDAAARANVATRVLDAEVLDVEPGTFDAAISRLGLMYVPDKPQALAAVRRALRPGGRYVAIVFAEPEANEFFSMPVAIVRRHAGLPPSAPGLPGPFSCVDLDRQLRAAGFEDVEVQRVAAPLRLSSAAECLRFERESFGALRQMLAGLDDAGRAAAWDEVGAALVAYDGPHGFAAPCDLLVGAATNP